MPSIAKTSIPPELTLLKQWVIWRLEDRDGRSTKVPYQATGYAAAVTNPKHWSTFEFASEAAARPRFASGVGFVFTPDDPYCGIDLDSVWMSDATETPRWANQIIDRFSDTYSEISPSGQGIKIWCRAQAPRCGRWAAGNGAIEVYDRARFFTVTGRHRGVLAIADHHRDIELLVGNLDAAGPKRQAPIEGMIQQGRRHRTLVSLAGAMRRRGVCLEAIEAALLKVNQHQCDPPYPPEHIRTKIIPSLKKWSS